MQTNLLIGASAAAIVASGAMASYTTTLGTSAPTYSTTLNFDEPGGPTGTGLAVDAFQADYGVIIESGDLQQNVVDATTQPGQSWLGSGYSFTGAYGVFLTFDEDLTDFSTRVWDPSGTPSPFGGGAAAFIFDDGVEVGFFAFTPSWGGVGDEWLNISATGGMVFDEVRILGFGFFPTTFVDDMSWNVVPAPGAAALFGLAGLAGVRRRR